MADCEPRPWVAVRNGDTSGLLAGRRFIRTRCVRCSFWEVGAQQVALLTLDAVGRDHRVVRPVAVAPVFTAVNAARAQQVAVLVDPFVASALTCVLPPPATVPYPAAGYFVSFVRSSPRHKSGEARRGDHCEAQPRGISRIV